MIYNDMHRRATKMCDKLLDYVAHLTWASQTVLVLYR